MLNPGKTRGRVGAILVVTTGVVYLLIAAGPAVAAGALGRLTLWGLVLLGCASWVGRLSGSCDRGAAHLAWDGAVGLAVWMVGLVALGQLDGAFSPGWLAVAVVVPGLSAVVWSLVRASTAKPGRSGSPEAASSNPSRGDGYLAPAAVVTIGLVWDRVPPVFFDTLAYHFAQPGLWLLEGRIAPESWSLHSWFPPGASVLYGVGLAWGGDAAANDANLLCGVLLLGQARDLARHLWGPTAGQWAFVVALLLPITIHALGVPGSDLIHGTFSFGALAAWVLWYRDGERVWLIRAALLAAGAVMTKYLGLVVPLGLGALLFAWGRPGGKNTLAARARRAAIFVLPAALGLAPWLGANSRTVGNPVAPVFAEALPTGGLAPGGIEAFRADARGGWPGGETPRELYRGLIAGDPDTTGIYPSPAWGIGPLLLLALALGFARQDREARVVAFVFVAVLLAWLLTFRWERFLVAASGMLALLCAFAIVRLGSWWGLVGRATAVLSLGLVAVAAVGAVRAVIGFTGGLPVALGLESEESFVRRAFPFHTVFDEAGHLLGAPGDRVLLVGDNRHHGLDIPHAAPTVFNVHPLVDALAQSSSPSQTTERLRAEGYTHLIVDLGWVERSAARYPSLSPLRRTPGRLESYLGSLGPPLLVHRGVALVSLPSESGMRNSATTGR